MAQLYFEKTISEQGFRAGEISSTNDKDANSIIREIIQNSYDSFIDKKMQINGAESLKSSIKFIVESISINDIPSIKEYREKIRKIKNNKIRDNEKDILDTITNELEKNSIDVLYVIDNGIGFDKKRISAVLGNGINEKDNPTGSGSYGNGHLTLFNISKLRYIFYAGKYIENNQIKEICAGQCKLASHKEDAESFIAKDGYYLKKYGCMTEDSIGVYEETLPEIMKNKIDIMDSTGGVVAIFGFDRTTFPNLENEIKKIVAKNFFIPIHKNEMEVSINETIINSTNLEAIFDDMKNEDSYKFFEVFKDGEVLEILTELGIAKIYYRQDEYTKSKIALCRNGMWTGELKGRKGHDLYINKFENVVSFYALFVPEGNELCGLIKQTEGNLHQDIDFNRLGKEEDKIKLKKAFEKIRKELNEKLEKLDSKEFDLNIEALKINFVDSKKKEESFTQKPMTTQNSGLIMSDDDGDNSGEEMEGDGKIKKQKKYKRIKISGVKSFVNFKDKSIKINVKIDRKDMYLKVYLKSGTDKSCDVEDRPGDMIQIQNLKIISGNIEATNNKNIIHIKTNNIQQKAILSFGYNSTIDNPIIQIIPCVAEDTKGDEND